jgi:hypothetical protein
MFGLAAQYGVERQELDRGHREYAVTCRLLHRQSGQVAGEGVGTCSTMESKYRYRSENTAKPVPSSYWQDRDPQKLGGPQFSAQKRAGKWVIVQRVEHGDPADHYNTVLKMAKKRAFVDAVLTATAAGDLFGQDLEDFASTQAAERERTVARSETVGDASASEQPAANNNQRAKATARRYQQLHPDTDRQQFLEWAAHTAGRESVPERLSQWDDELCEALEAKLDEEQTKPSEEDIPF